MYFTYIEPVLKVVIDEFLLISENQRFISLIFILYVLSIGLDKRSS